MATDDDASAGLKRPAPMRGAGCRRNPPALPALAMAVWPAIAVTAVSAGAPARLPDSGPLSDDLPFLDTRAADYRTPLAGEDFRTEILGEEVMVPIRDVRQIQA